MILWFLSCSSPDVCGAKEPMRLALESRLGALCSQIDPRGVETLNLSNWSEPLDGDPILSSFKNQ